MIYYKDGDVVRGSDGRPRSFPNPKDRNKAGVSKGIVDDCIRLLEKKLEEKKK